MLSISASVRMVLFTEPPATSTVPSARSVAVWLLRVVVMAPVAVQVLAMGSNSSAPVGLPEASVPPTTSTEPLARSVAVPFWRAASIGGPAVQLAAPMA